MADDPNTILNRQESLDEAIASLAIEGLALRPEDEALMKRWVSRELTDLEMLEQGLASIKNRSPNNTRMGSGG